MIKLNAQKDNTVKFEIDVSNGEGLEGHFRLVHEGVEYGFPVHIFGNRNKAEAIIPALEKIIPNLKKTAVLEARLEFTGNGDYICAWNSKAKVEVPRVQVKVDEEVVVSEEDPSDETPAAKLIDEEEEMDVDVVVSTGPFAVSDDAFAAAAEKTKTEGKSYIELYEAVKIKKIKTSTDDGHWHKAEVDDEGDGKTVGTFSVAVKGNKPNPHIHKIVGTELKKEKSHTHSII
jgi:hypothetical protein